MLLNILNFNPQQVTTKKLGSKVLTVLSIPPTKNDAPVLLEDGKDVPAEVQPPTAEESSAEVQLPLAEEITAEEVLLKFSLQQLKRLLLKYSLPQQKRLLEMRLLLK